MRGLTPRYGLLGGVLLIAVGALVWDRVSGSRQPATAHAVEAQAPVPLASADWEPVAGLVAQLTTSAYVPVGEELARLKRDVFVPTPMIEEAIAPATSMPAAPAAVTTEDPNAPAEADFAARHKLIGVMLAGRPLAAVDDRVLAINSDLDGYTLIEVQRDYVVFQQATSGARVTLKLEQGPKKR
jgi:hypothetical protein